MLFSRDMGKHTWEHLFGLFPWSARFFAWIFRFFHEFNFFYPEMPWVVCFFHVLHEFRVWISCFFRWISFFLMNFMFFSWIPRFFSRSFTCFSRIRASQGIRAPKTRKHGKFSSRAHFGKMYTKTTAQTGQKESIQNYFPEFQLFLILRLKIHHAFPPSRFWCCSQPATRGGLFLQGATIT